MILGDGGAVVETCSRFRKALASSGLLINNKKCCALMEEGVDASAGVSIAPPGEPLVVLGFPVKVRGWLDAAFCAEASRRAAEKLTTLSEFGFAQGELKVLQSCGPSATDIFASVYVPLDFESFTPPTIRLWNTLCACLAGR